MEENDNKEARYQKQAEQFEEWKNSEKGKQVLQNLGEIGKRISESLKDVLPNLPKLNYFSNAKIQNHYYSQIEPPDIDLPESQVSKLLDYLQNKEISQAELKGREIATNHINSLPSKEYRDLFNNYLKDGFYNFEYKYQQYFNDVGMVGVAAANKRLEEANQKLKNGDDAIVKKWLTSGPTTKQQLHFDSDEEYEKYQRGELEPRIVSKEEPNSYEHTLMMMQLRSIPTIKFNEWLMSLTADGASSENLAKVGMEKREPTQPEPPAFDGLFKSPAHIDALMNALRELEKINIDDVWQGQKNELGVLADVLNNKGYFLKVWPDSVVVPILANRFGIIVSDRVTRDRPPKDKFKIGLKAILPTLPNLP